MYEFINGTLFHNNICPFDLSFVYSCPVVTYENFKTGSCMIQSRRRRNAGQSQRQTSSSTQSKDHDSARRTCIDFTCRSSCSLCSYCRRWIVRSKENNVVMEKTMPRLTIDVRRLEYQSYPFITNTATTMWSEARSLDYHTRLCILPTAERHT